MKDIKIHVVVCFGRQDISDGVVKYAQKYQNEGHRVRIEHHDQVVVDRETDTVEILFLTPDQTERILALTIDKYTDVGSAYKHPHYRRFMDILLSRIRSEKALLSGGVNSDEL